MENSNFKRILIVGGLAEHRKSIAAAVIRCTTDARVAGCDVAKQAYPGPRFNWAVYDLLIIDATDIAPAAKAWLEKIMSMVKLPPVIVTSWHATIDDAGDFYRLGVSDYMAFNNPNVHRMRIALANTTRQTAKQADQPTPTSKTKPAEDTGSKVKAAPASAAPSDTPAASPDQATIEKEHDSATTSADTKPEASDTPAQKAPVAENQPNTSSPAPEQTTESTDEAVTKAATVATDNPAVAAANEAIGPDLDDVDEDEDFEDEESSGYEDLSQMSQSLLDDDEESSSSLQDPSFVTSGLMSILDREPEKKQHARKPDNNKPAAEDDEESSGSLQDPSFVTSGLMSILDRGPEAETANRTEEDSASLQDPSFVTSGLLSILANDKKPPANSENNSDHMEASFVTSGLMSILENHEQPNSDNKVSSGFGYGWPFTPEDIEKGNAWLGDYQIIEFLSLGASSSVFKTRLKGDDEMKALKLFKPDTNDEACKARFHRGYELISSVSHPNIAKVYGPGEHEHWLYVVMEYFPKSDLKSRLRHALKPEKVISYALQICDGLSAAHEQGIIHRALKPSDILFREDGSLALADFGISKTMVAGDNELTKEGLTVGKPDYISPEQATGKLLTARSDLYSVGIILYEMLEGRRPFIGASVIDTMKAHLTTPMPPIARGPDCLKNIIRKLLEKNPQDRYPDCETAINALKDCQ